MQEGFSRRKEGQLREQRNNFNSQRLCLQEPIGQRGHQQQFFPNLEGSHTWTLQTQFTFEIAPAHLHEKPL